MLKKQRPTESLTMLAGTQVAASTLSFLRVAMNNGGGAVAKLISVAMLLASSTADGGWDSGVSNGINGESSLTAAPRRPSKASLIPTIVASMERAAFSSPTVATSTFSSLAVTVVAATSATSTMERM